MKHIDFNGTAVTPSKVVCVGLNYAAHIEEMNNAVPDEPVIFMKPNASVCDEVYAGADGTVHYEGEISFVIMDGRLRGVGFGLDLTRRDLQSTLIAAGRPWERAKAFNNAAVFSRFVPFDGTVDDLRLELRLNDALVQQGGCGLMLYKPDALRKNVARFLAWEDGDVLMTGTPAGVGPLKTGDRLAGRIFEQDTLIVERSWVVR